MTGVDRVRKTLAFERTDRVAVIPLIIQHALEISDVKHSYYSTNPQVMADTVIACRDYYGYDGVYVSSDNYVICEAMGGKLSFPDDEPPQLIRHAVQNGDLNTLNRFTVESGRIPVILEATRLCRQRLGDRIFVKTNIDSAPFSATTSLYGAQDFLINLYDHENKAFKLLDICTEAIILYGKAAARAGAHGLAFGDSVSGLLGREMYQRFALPYARNAITELKQTGLPVFYHVCGDTSHISDLIVETGADCVEINSVVPMEQIKPIAAGKCALEGNINTIEVLLQGSPDDVLNESNKIIKLFGNNSGLILSSGCEIPRFSPRENVAAIMQAATEYSY